MIRYGIVGHNLGYAFFQEKTKIAHNLLHRTNMDTHDVSVPGYNISNKTTYCYLLSVYIDPLVQESWSARLKQK